MHVDLPIRHAHYGKYLTVLSPRKPRILIKEIVIIPASRCCRPRLARLRVCRAVRRAVSKEVQSSACALTALPVAMNGDGRRLRAGPGVNGQAASPPASGGDGGGSFLTHDACTLCTRCACVRQQQ